MGLMKLRMRLMKLEDKVDEDEKEVDGIDEEDIAEGDAEDDADEIDGVYGV